jgi:uncharacterized damage-inducible protein DinB
MIKKYAAYNLWANERLIECMGSINAELLNAEVNSSFKSIRKTLYHIYDAESIWHARLSDNPSVVWPPSQHFSELDLPSVTLQASKNLVALVSNADENFFKSNTSYRNTKGEAYLNNNEEILHHVFNHSAFHRGQIVTLLRQLGATEIPSTDFITYARMS